jgi:hypothetical protein
VYDIQFCRIHRTSPLELELEVQLEKLESFQFMVEADAQAHMKTRLHFSSVSVSSMRAAGSCET